MAVFDRIRDRLGRGNGGGWNGGDRPSVLDRRNGGDRPSVSGGLKQRYSPLVPEMNQADAIDAILRSQSDSVREARSLGARMGAEESIRDAGMALNNEKRILAEDSGRLMNRQRLNEATKLLLQYKAGKASVDRRVIRAQQWWKLRNWEQIEANRGTKGATVRAKSNTGWLWNCIVGKHADAIDAYPEPVILPREEGDKPEAEKLSKIVPVVMEMNGFEQTYNDAAWQKMQEGTAVYGTFWDPDKLNGLGDISIKKENILNLFWEPNVTNIQDSRNVFYCTLVDKDILVQQHPELEGQLKVNKLSLEKYRTDDNVDLSKKAVLIDWYYHTYDGPRKILQYCQYVDEYCLYSSEEESRDDPEYRGYYQHGKYPFVLSPLFPVEGSPAGYGYIDIAKDTQSDIDTLSQAMVQNAAARSTPRYFVKKDGSINEEEFADWSKPLIHCSGMLGQDSVRAVEVMAMGGDAHNMLQQKIDEIKFICGNTDVNNGGVPSGVTAASAIAALKEDSGRSSKDSTKAAYRAYRKIVIMVIERIRQFYDIPRQFRILGAQGQEEFVQYDNSHLQPQIIPNMPGDEPGMRIPMYDVEVRAQRENAYTKMSQNELALQFYDKGFFAPGNGDQALLCLEMMDFRNKEEVKKRIEQQGTMMQTLMKVGQIALMLAQKFQPEVAPKLTEALQGIQNQAGKAPQPMGGGQQKPGRSDSVTAPADNTSAPNPNENQLVRRARERSEEATRPS